MLLYAFLTESEVDSVKSILESLNEGRNSKLFKNLGLTKKFLQRFHKHKKNEQTARALNRAILKAHTQASDEKFTGAEHVDTVLKKFGKLGEAAVVTPKNICADMVALIPYEAFSDAIKTGKKFLDIAGTSGEFAIALYDRMKTLDIPEKEIRNAIYTIPKSSICYELTRKVYTLLGLNVENIASEFVAADLLGVKTDDKIDYDKIKRLLTQNKPFNTIKLTDDLSQGGTNMMTFDAVVGNPPYQEDSAGDSTGTNPIYHLFVDITQEMTNKASLIMPARFLFNAGKTPKAWNTKMLNDKHLRVAYYEQNPDKVFPGIPITGGITIIHWDKNIEYGAIGTFVPYNHLNEIISKVKISGAFESIQSIIFVHSKFNLELLYNINPNYKLLVGSNGRDRRVRANAFEVFDFFTEQKSADDIRVLGLLGNKRTYRFVHSQYLEPVNWVNKYKVFVPESNGASGMLGAEPARIISRPALGLPNDGVTQTFIVVGAFETHIEAENLQKYIFSKFCRLLLGSLKATQRNNASTWANVPMQDFTEQSDIDWSKSIPEIDKQLYAKYGLSPDEISFIESMIKPME